MKGKIFTVQEVDTITPFGEIRKQNLDKLERHYLKLLTGKKPMKLGQDNSLKTQLRLAQEAMDRAALVDQKRAVADAMARGHSEELAMKIVFEVINN